MQIASAVRFIWPAFFGKKAPLWESTPYAEDGLHFVVTEGDMLISHALVSSRKLEHRGETFNVYGLSSVFCYPSHRGSGLGEQVVTAATDYIRKQDDADFALLFCGERVKSLYLRQGWEHLPELKVTYGDNQTYGDGYVLTLLISERARAHARAHRFDEDHPLYVGRNTW